MVLRMIRCLVLDVGGWQLIGLMIKGLAAVQRFCGKSLGQVNKRRFAE